MNHRPHLSFCARETTTLGPELLVSMGPALICGFMHSKQRIYNQNYKCICVPDLFCGFCMQNRDLRTRIASLYESQTSPVVLCMQNSVISNRITSLYGSQPSSVVLCIQNSEFSTRITSFYVAQN